MQPRPGHLMDYLEFPILYVDDEPQNLRIFELTFNREFTILCAESAEEGMEKSRQLVAPTVGSLHVDEQDVCATPARQSDGLGGPVGIGDLEVLPAKVRNAAGRKDEQRPVALQVFQGGAHRAKVGDARAVLAR